MKRRFLSLTRTRLLSALCWAVVLAAGLASRFFPVTDLPLPFRLGVHGRHHRHHLSGHLYRTW